MNPDVRAAHGAAPDILGRLRRRLFGISAAEASFERRRFPSCDATARARLEAIGATFIRGYCAALEEPRADPLASKLDEVDPELRGFAYEGAAMGLALLDHLTVWRRDRFARFATGPGAPHVYMVHVGAGWAMARLNRRIGPDGPSLPGPAADPLLRWLVVDGYGFHEGYFHWESRIRDRKAPAHLGGYARRAFDQGLGRSLWFVTGASVERAKAAIGAFEPARRPDLWSGVGLASVYAGGLDRAGLETLREASVEYARELAQGAAFAAKARQRAGNLTDHTDLACAVFCSMSADSAARLTDEALRDLRPEGAEPAYETWRRRVRDHFGPAGSLPPRLSRATRCETVT